MPQDYLPEENQLIINDGFAAKGAFYLSILLNEESSPSDKAGALLNILEDLDNILTSISAEERITIMDCLNQSLSNVSSVDFDSFKLNPDNCNLDSSLIDGTTIKRAIISGSPKNESPTVIAQGRLHSGLEYIFRTEYTFMSKDRAFLEVVNSSSTEVLRSVHLNDGYNQIVSLKISTLEESEDILFSIRISNHSTHDPVLWYQTTVWGSQESRNSMPFAESLTQSFRKKRINEKKGILKPVTNEPLTMEDVTQLNSLRNKYAGERIFIMGNGPSLNNTPLELLKDEYVFGLNRVGLLFERISWRPTFFTAFDIRVVPDNKEEFLNLDIPYKFFSARYKTLFGRDKFHYWYHTKGFYDGFESCFNKNAIYSGFGGGGTIAIIATELAFLMGFREIYLIGTDVSYTIPPNVIQSGKDEFGNGFKLNLESTEDNDPNHFDPRYFGKGKKWHNPNVRDMKIGFSRAASYIQQRGGSLLNATVGGDLDEVSRVNFRDLF